MCRSDQTMAAGEPGEQRRGGAASHADRQYRARPRGAGCVPLHAGGRVGRGRGHPGRGRDARSHPGGCRSPRCTAPARGWQRLRRRCPTGCGRGFLRGGDRRRQRLDGRGLALPWALLGARRTPGSRGGGRCPGQGGLGRPGRSCRSCRTGHPAHQTGHGRSDGGVGVPGGGQVPGLLVAGPDPSAPDRGEADFRTRPRLRGRWRGFGRPMRNRCCKHRSAAGWGR